MTILLVDDDIYMLRSLQKNVNWEKIGIEDLHTAVSVKQAQGILTQYSIDILLCDIEMPQGSGLDLLEWVREKGMPVEALFLTSYPSFDYAKRAISLESLEYILKPVDYSKLEAALKKAIEKSREKQDNLIRRRQNDYLKDDREGVSTYFWSQVVSGRYEGKSEELFRALERSMLPWDPLSRLLPIMVKIVDRDNSPDTAPDEIKAVISELFTEAFHCKEQECVVLKREEEHIAFLGGGDYSTSNIEITDVISDVIAKIRERFAVDLFCGIGPRCHIYELYRVVRDIREMLEDNVANLNKPVFLMEFEPQNVPYASTELSLFRSELEQGDPDSFLKAVERYLDGLAGTSVSVKFLKHFRLDITQIVYTYLSHRKISAHERFNEEHYERAVRSIEDMKAYVRYLTGYEQEEMQHGTGIVSQVVDYIDRNYRNDIQRSDLSKLVWLNPDYIARLFKKEMGQSIGSYVIARRIEYAKQLLRDKNIPINEVSSMSGYDSFAYFSRLFKRNEGCSPSEYRKRIQE